MNKFFAKLGVVQSFSILLKINTHDFVTALTNLTEPWQPDVFNMFSFDKKKYKGHVNSKQFEISRTKTHIASFESTAKASGEIEEMGNEIEVNITIKPKHFYYRFSGLVFFSSVLFLAGAAIFMADGLKGAFVFWLLDLIVFSVSIGLMRWGVLSLRYDIEDDLVEIGKSKLH